MVSFAPEITLYSRIIWLGSYIESSLRSFEKSSKRKKKKKKSINKPQTKLLVGFLFAWQILSSFNVEQFKKKMLWKIWWNRDIRSENIAEKKTRTSMTTATVWLLVHLWVGKPHSLCSPHIFTLATHPFRQRSLE